MKEKARAAKPVARREGLVIQELPGEVLVYDLERDRAHCLNESAAFVWQRCDGRNSTAQIAVRLGHQFDCKVDEKIVWVALDQLGRSHLLEKHFAVPQTMSDMNRRAMVRALGLTAAVAIPLVTSILAPTAQAATSCLGSGATCSTSAQCCSSLCNAGQCT